jgi:hypothetical protein
MDIFTLAQRPYQELIPIIRQDLPVHVLSDVARSLNIPISTLARKLHVLTSLIISVVFPHGSWMTMRTSWWNQRVLRLC